MRSEAELKRVASFVLDQAKLALKGCEALVVINDSHDRHLRFARNGVTTSGDVESTELRLTLKLGSKVSRASTSQLGESDLKGFVDRLAGLTKVAPEEPEAQGFLGAQRFVRSPHVFDGRVAGLPYVELTKLAKRLIEPSVSAGLQAAGFLSAVTSHDVIASTAGLSGSGQSTCISLAVTSRTADGKGSGREAIAARTMTALESQRLGQEAARTAESTAKLRPLAPGRYTVVLEPNAVAELLGFFVEALDARAAEEGRSFFSKPGGGSRLGEALCSPLVSLSSSPLSKETPTYPWDEEGFALTPRAWVTQGKLTELMRTRTWAEKTKQPPTGRYRGFSLAPGTTPRADLLTGIKRGVLVKRLWYTNLVEPKNLLVTGLTRDGTFLIEDGQVVGAVNNFRVNVGAAEVLSRCDAIASAGGQTDSVLISTPALRSHDFNFSSVSEAV